MINDILGYKCSCWQSRKKEAELKKKLTDQFKQSSQALPIMRLPPGYKESGEEQDSEVVYVHVHIIFAAHLHVHESELVSAFA